MTEGERVDTVGCIESVTVDGHCLEVRGWTGSPEGGLPTELVLWVDHRECAVARYELGSGPASGLAGWPAVWADTSCRFHISLLVGSGARARLRDRLVEVRPVFGGRNGRSMFGVIEPTLRLPSADDQRAFGDDFLGTAYWLLGHCVNYAGLRPQHCVLDVGCGAGRLAYALASYLGVSGSYEGFDAHAGWIRSAQGALACFPRFAFRTVDVRNSVYNPEGGLDGGEFAFPYASRSFDRVCAISIFQHNRPAVVRRYLREIARVLRPGGQCLVTCFLLDSDSDRLEADKRAASLNFLHPIEGAWAADRDRPEIGIAHEQAALEAWSREANLAVRSVREGTWRGGQRVLSWQDVVILQRPEADCSAASDV
jgi:SAM-dependent methyltransferase